MSFRRILRKYIINNIGYKILAVVFSFLLWLVILNVSDPEQTRMVSNVPVQILNENLVLDGEHVYTISSGRTINIMLTGNRSIITSLIPSDFTVTADFAELSITNAVPIKIALRGSKARYNNQISITGSETSMLISLEEMTSKQIPVEVEYRGEALDNVVIEEANITPKKITINAPESITDSAERAVVSPNYAEIRNDTILYLTPSIRDINNDPIKDSPYVSLDEPLIAVEFITSEKKNVPISVNVSGSPADGYAASEPELSQDYITVKGPKEDVDALEVIEIPAELVDITGAAEDVAVEIDVTPYLPENVVVYGESPTMTVTIRITPKE